jgi:hypothetical protein
MKKIVLTYEEMGKASWASLRQYNKKKYKTSSRFENHFIGKLGEMAYGKEISQAVNLEHFHDRGDGGCDFEGVQVKTITWAGANKQLKVDKNDASLTNKEIQKFVLLYADLQAGGTEVYLVGEISKKNFLKKCYKDPKFSGDCYVVDEKDLDKTFEN